MTKYCSDLYDRENYKIEIDKEPEICPLCINYNIPNELSGRMVKDDYAQIAFQCTNRACNNVFIASYTRTKQFENYFHLSNLQPTKFMGTVFSEEITSVSLNFTEIYNQSEAAEHHNLELISGVGYRKSLEFLIKDYLIKIDPSKSELIKSTLIGQCIDKWIDDPKIKKCAKLATWLGNDETHYERKWKFKDINDLKSLIRLTLMWIESNILTQKYEEDFQ
jgi:hypothetical protein